MLKNSEGKKKQYLIKERFNNKCRFLAANLCLKIEKLFLKNERREFNTRTNNTQNHFPIKKTC